MCAILALPHLKTPPPPVYALTLLPSGLLQPNARARVETRVHRNARQEHFPPLKIHCSDNPSPLLQNPQSLHVGQEFLCETLTLLATIHQAKTETKVFRVSQTQANLHQAQVGKHLVQGQQQAAAGVQI